MLAALFNGMLLMAACGAIAWGAFEQLMHPIPVQGLTVSVVAGVGILVNGISAWMFMAGSKDDLNIRGAYLHLAADAAISLGVLISGLIVLSTGWSWLDPLVSLVIVLFITKSTWSLLRESADMVLAAVPGNVDPTEVEQFLRAHKGVTDIHDLHIWSMSTTDTALTCHLVMPGGYPGDQAIDEIARELREQFAIHHTTLQTEQGTTEHNCCLQKPAEEHDHGHDHDHHDHDHAHGHH
jgi:cobalt-zinc-cadmium efflux system protein